LGSFFSKPHQALSAFDPDEKRKNSLPHTRTTLPPANQQAAPFPFHLQ
jgi:hypothetical protein